MLRPFRPVACCFALLGIVASVCTPITNNVASCNLRLLARSCYKACCWCKLLITVDNIKCFKKHFFGKIIVRMLPVKTGLIQLKDSFIYLFIYLFFTQFSTFE